MSRIEFRGSDEIFKTQNGWTKAKMIDHIVTNFKGQSIDNEGNCLYRGDNGLKCAVGLFIPDKEYHSSFESKSAFVICGKDSILADYMPLDKWGMDRLQSQHDNSDSKDTLSAMLNWIDQNVED